MAPHLIVPVDGSDTSWRAFDVALALARRCGADVRAVEVACDPVDANFARERLRTELALRGPFDIDVVDEVRLNPEYVADELEKAVAERPGSIVVMSSHGRGRSAAIVGSVAEGVLRRTLGPIVVVGPRVTADDLSGPIVVTVDGSAESEAALPVASEWAWRLSTSPTIVHVRPPESRTGTSARLDPNAFVSGLRADSVDDVDLQELSGRQPGRNVAEYAASVGASLIVASSHGRGGLSRLVMGSVTASFVRHAACPIMVMRLGHGERIQR